MQGPLAFGRFASLLVSSWGTFWVWWIWNKQVPRLCSFFFFFLQRFKWEGTDRWEERLMDGMMPLTSCGDSSLKNVVRRCGKMRRKLPALAGGAFGQVVFWLCEIRDIFTEKNLKLNSLAISLESPVSSEGSLVLVKWIELLSLFFLSPSSLPPSRIYRTPPLKHCSWHWDEQYTEAGRNPCPSECLQEWEKLETLGELGATARGHPVDDSYVVGSLLGNSCVY